LGLGTRSNITAQPGLAGKTGKWTSVTHRDKKKPNHGSVRGKGKSKTTPTQENLIYVESGGHPSKGLSDRIRDGQMVKPGTEFSGSYLRWRTSDTGKESEQGFVGHFRVSQGAESQVGQHGRIQRVK